MHRAQFSPDIREFFTTLSKVHETTQSLEVTSIRSCLHFMSEGIKYFQDIYCEPLKLNSEFLRRTVSLY